MCNMLKHCPRSIQCVLCTKGAFVQHLYILGQPCSLALPHGREEAILAREQACPCTKHAQNMIFEVPMHTTKATTLVTIHMLNYNTCKTHILICKSTQKHSYDHNTCNHFTCSKFTTFANFNTHNYNSCNYSSISM